MITTQMVERIDRNINLLINKHLALDAELKKIKNIMENVDARLKSGSIKTNEDEHITGSDADVGDASKGSSETKSSGKSDSDTKDKVEGRDEKTPSG